MAAEYKSKRRIAVQCLEVVVLQELEKSYMNLEAFIDLFAFCYTMLTHNYAEVKSYNPMFENDKCF